MTASARVYWLVAEKIKQVIQEQALELGQRLPPERKLAEHLNVSRSTVREALIALEVCGVLEIRPGSGVYFVGEQMTSALMGEMHLPGPLEILEARLCIEPALAALAAKRMTAQERHELQEIQQRMSESSKLDNIHQFDRQFHELLARSSGNTSLYHIVRHLWDCRLRSQLNQTFDRLLQTRGANPICQEHFGILQAIVQQDSERVETLMRAHLERVMRELMSFSLQEETDSK